MHLAGQQYETSEQQATAGGQRACSSERTTHSVASGSEGGQNYISYDIENFIGRKKYQSVALESSFRTIYVLFIDF